LKLALKVDVATLRGTRDGVPRLLEMFKRQGIGATFLFALGPDRSGLHGKLLPAPQLGKRCAPVLRRVRDEGFEVGVHAWDAARWKSLVAHGDGRQAGWQMELAVQRFHEVFGESPAVHGAPGWRMNVHAFRRTQSMGFHYASDTTGTHPFIPVVRAELIACPQFPTTLPTLDEAPVEKIVASTNGRRDHVFTLHAERCGPASTDALGRLIAAWRGLGYAVTSLRELASETNFASLPLHEVVDVPGPGRSRRSVQGRVFLAETSAP
jgi:undecaprenyl phosphate-alpha-L-ara4FN deformylase